ncbi:MAG: flagellar hook-length control protein FliK [Porticoccaceae bacterium]|nr:flagellar hook-length control protein FliK [Porticoccaceae bacterium]
MLTANSASTSAASGEGGKGEAAFSNHLKAQQRGEQKTATSPKTDAASGRNETAVEHAGTEDKAAKAESARMSEKTAEKMPGKEKGKASEALAKASEQARADTSHSDNVLATNAGLQRAPALGLSDRELEAPFATMGERVLALLAANDVATDEGIASGASPINLPALAEGGNESPLEGQSLPQQGADAETEVDAEPLLFAGAMAGLESQPADGEALAPGVADAAVAVKPAQGDPAQVAASLRQGPVVTENELELSNTAPLRPLPNAELASATRSALPSAAAALARTVPGKTLTEPSASLDAEPDADLDLVLNPNKSTQKPGLLEGSVVKQPTSAGAENLGSPSASKDNFAQVRQNIMAAMAGKSDIPSPLNAAVAGAGLEVSEPSPQQSLNVSSLSSTLALSGNEPAKYSATQETSPQRSFTLQTPVGQPGWDAELGNRIRWMVGQNNSGVELRLNPPELGSIEVKLITEGERTSVTFISSNPAAREALEAALPRLREMFAESGMDLANADVADRGLQQEREQLAGSDGFAADADGSEGMVLEAGLELTQGQPAEGRGVIDYYI